VSHKRSKATKIFCKLSESNPDPKTELEYTNPYQLIVAVVLSAQATDVSVNKATKSLFEIVTTPMQMLSIGEEGLISYIKSIGLYKAKAKNVIALSQMLIEEYHSEIPNKFDDLIKLPGVGRKTANVVLNCLFDEPTIAVDTHVFRVSKRLGLAKGNTPEKVEEEILGVVPDKYLRNAHHWLILHGRYVCKARKPECDKCEIAEYCDYYSEVSK